MVDLFVGFFVLDGLFGILIVYLLRWWFVGWFTGWLMWFDLCLRLWLVVVPVMVWIWVLLVVYVRPFDLLVLFCSNFVCRFVDFLLGFGCIYGLLVNMAFALFCWRVLICLVCLLIRCFKCDVFDCLWFCFVCFGVG